MIAAVITLIVFVTIWGSIISINKNVQRRNLSGDSRADDYLQRAHEELAKIGRAIVYPSPLEGIKRVSPLEIDLEGFKTRTFFGKDCMFRWKDISKPIEIRTNYVKNRSGHITSIYYTIEFRHKIKNPSFGSKSRWLSKELVSQEYIWKTQTLSGPYKRMGMHRLVSLMNMARDKALGSPNATSVDQPMAKSGS